MPRISYINFIKRKLIFFVCVFGVVLFATFPARSVDVVKIVKPRSELDQRRIYPDKVLEAALMKTVKEFGPYTIKRTVPEPARKRLLRDLITGSLVNVHSTATRLEWERESSPILIPIRKGLLGYRLFLVDRQDLSKFAAVRSAADLKALRVGLHAQWSTTKALKKIGFTVVGGSSYEGLFAMLNYQRFDYFPRGINEIYPEFESRRAKFPNMVIEPKLTLLLPLPTYMFVSPSTPRLFNRIKAGLEIMVEDGSLDRLFQEFHGEFIRRADLKNRLILKVDNPFLSTQTPFAQKNLWLHPGN